MGKKALRLPGGSMLEGLEGTYWKRYGEGRVIRADLIPSKYWEDYENAWSCSSTALPLERAKGPVDNRPGGGIPNPKGGGWTMIDYQETWAWIPEEYFVPKENELGEIAP